MSYKTEFASNNTDLQTILDKVNALPDEGEGGTVDTCTVVLQADSSLSRKKGYYAVTRYVDGAFIADGIYVPIDSVDFYSNPVTLENVVCGSAVMVFFEASIAMLSCASDKGTDVRFYSHGSRPVLIDVTDTPDVTTTITMSDLD